MKKIILSLSAFFLVLLISYANDNQKPIKSDIKEVTVFISGAQVSRTGTINLTAGTTEVVFENLSQNININSIQANGKGDFTILSVVHQMNYLKNQAKSKEQIVLEDSLERYQQQLEYQKGLQGVYIQEANMIIANQSLGGANTGVKAQEIKEAADFFRTRLSDIKMKQIEIAATIKKINEKINNVNNQLATLNAKMNQPSSEIIVSVSAKSTVNASITINYLVTNAGWIPCYDLRATDINNPIALNYKANVYQSSGEDWKNVKLTLSTSNPNQSGTKPNLNPWILRFYAPQNYRSDYNPYNQQAPQAARSESTLEEVVYVEGVRASKAKTSASFTSVVESQTSVQFEINIPYTINADGKQHAVEIQTFSLPAKYEYYCAPKIDREAFLLARVTNWDQYNLLSGEVNLFYEGTYVGKSYIETRTAKDTLDFSLGRDKNISVTRIKLKEFSSTTFAGINKKELVAWEINVRNKKKQDINIVVQDQFPVSGDKEIEVERLEMSGGNYNTDTGIVTWNLNIKAGESVKNLIMKYTVKYPKNKEVILN